MFCRHCGKELADDVAVCLNCGCWVASEIAQEEPQESNGMAIAGFVCSFFMPILGWIFGGIGLSRANRRNGKGKGFSIAAIAIASSLFFLGIIALL